jgi:hypothetical protein
VDEHHDAGGRKRGGLGDERAEGFWVHHLKFDQRGRPEREREKEGEGNKQGATPYDKARSSFFSASWKQATSNESARAPRTSTATGPRPPPGCAGWSAAHHGRHDAALLRRSARVWLPFLPLGLLLLLLPLS